MRRLAALPLLLAASVALASPRTLALLVAAPTGGPGRAALPAAADDAAHLRETLAVVGDLGLPGSRLLVDPAPDEVLLALGELEAEARAAAEAGDEVTLVVWVAGHASGPLLHLGGATLDLSKLTALLQTSPAARRLALFDLVSGRAAFTLDGPGEAGLVALTSESPGAEAWRSPLSGRSHLAFHVVNGLRGAADADQDGEVSAAELLAWVAARARQPPPPALATGWPPLARRPAGGLELAPGVPRGLHVVVDGQGRVAGELEAADRGARLWLPPGPYVLKTRGDGGLLLARVELTSGPPRVVGADQYSPAPLSRDPVRRAEGPGGEAARWSLAAGADYRLFTDAVLPSSPLLGVELTLHRLLLGSVGFGLDGGYGWAAGTLAAPGLDALAWSSTLTTVGLSARYEWNSRGRLAPFVGLRLELDLLARTFADPTWAAQSATVLVPGALLGLTVRLGVGLSLAARARVGYVGLSIDAPRSLAATDLGLQLRYEPGARP